LLTEVLERIHPAVGHPEVRDDRAALIFCRHIFSSFPLSQSRSISLDRGTSKGFRGFPGSPQVEDHYRQLFSAFIRDICGRFASCCFERNRACAFLLANGDSRI
jgi:hypothetical protein